MLYSLVSRNVDYRQPTFLVDSYTPEPTYDPGEVDPGLIGFAAMDGGTTGGSGGQTEFTSLSQLISRTCNK